jgi:hypothetical protein
LEPVESVPSDVRQFVVVRRGIDEFHTEPQVRCPNQSIRDRFPPILEIDPRTGATQNVLDGESAGMFTFRDPISPCLGSLCPGGDMECPAEVTANPIIAYDGTTLFAAVERCGPGEPAPCPSLVHALFRINPNLNPGDANFVSTFGNILFDTGEDGTLTGMAEKGGFLFALNTTTNKLRFWDKTMQATLTNGGVSIDLASLTGTGDGTVFDDVDGDIGTDGTHLYIPLYTVMGASRGIGRFTATVGPDGMGGTMVTVTFVDGVADPVTNESLNPGPRLGGLDFIAPDVMVVTDRNGPIVEHWDIVADRVRAYKLPRGFVIDRTCIR